CACGSDHCKKVGSHYIFPVSQGTMDKETIVYWNNEFPLAGFVGVGKATATKADGESEAETPLASIPDPQPLAEFVAEHPNMRAPIIDGLLREGETANIISASKIGKSWLAY